MGETTAISCTLVCPHSSLVKERDELRAEVERLREQLAATRAALKKAIGIAEQLVRHHGDYFNCRYRLSELSMVARDD